MISKIKNSPNWKNQENEVGAIYRLLGYKVTLNVNINGQQTDLLCEKQISGAGAITLYVDSKYSDNDTYNSISKDDVTQFIYNFHSLKAIKGWTAGVMVSNKEFTQYAKAAAAQHPDIILKTIDDLYSDLFQIHAYLHSCVNIYESEGLFDDYIPLRAKYYNEMSQKYETDNLEVIFNKWLAEPYAPQLCVLGDFGAGKTTFIRKIHYGYAKEFLNNNFNRMPIFIQLRDYYDARDSQDLMERFFANEVAVKVPHKIFNKFSREGRFLIFLDGFDEMGATSDAMIRKKNYFKLAQLISPNAKIVITCRPAYFVTNEELFDVFGYYKQQLGQLKQETKGDKAHTKPFISLSDRLKRVSQSTRLGNIIGNTTDPNSTPETVSIQLFDSSQIKSYL